MADRLQLKPRHRRVLEEILPAHVPGIEAWANGSRVCGRSHGGSDLDLVLRAPDLEEIPVEKLVDMEDALRESTIPFLVEARDWARLPESFQREIERDNVVVGVSKRGNPRGSLTPLRVEFKVAERLELMNSGPCNVRNDKYAVLGEGGKSRAGFPSILQTRQNDCHSLPKFTLSELSVKTD